MAEHESSLAVLIDYENMARPGGRGRNFDVSLVLNRLSDKGRVLVKRAYADWSRYRDARHDLQNLGLGLIEMPSAQEGAKNRADIQMAVDAMELAYSREHVDHFAIVSGDSDFTPLVGKLRELNKRVLGVGLRNATSELLVANCDEFIYYESLTTAARRAATESHDPLELLRETLQALAREGSETPLASHVNDTMKRKDPAFDYGSLGFGTLSRFLEEMASEGVVKLEKDPRSGTYRVSLADGSAPAKASRRTEGGDRAEGGDRESSSQQPPRRRRRRRRGGGRGSDADADAGTPDTDGSDGQADEDAAEIFEHVVGDSQAAADSDLPPVDEPISYEDMIMLTPDIDGETELIEASDTPDADAPPARSARRRRRRGATADPEPTGADLAELSEELAAESSGDEAEAPTEPDTTEPTAEGASAEDGEDATSGRRRRRRTTPAPTPPSAPESAAASEADEEPSAEDADPSEPVVDPVAAAAEATSTRRRVRRKSSTHDDDEQAEEKPKRRGTTRAKKAGTEEAAQAEEKPKRRRTTRAKKAESEGADAAEAEATEEKPKRRRTTRAKKAESEDTASK